MEPMPDFVTAYDNFFMREFDSMKDLVVFVGEQLAAGHKVDTWKSPDRTSFRAFVFTNPKVFDTRPYRMENR
jgi:hypothetical protein